MEKFITNPYRFKKTFRKKIKTTFAHLIGLLPFLVDQRKLHVQTVGYGSHPEGRTFLASASNLGI